MNRSLLNSVKFTYFSFHDYTLFVVFKSSRIGFGSIEKLVLANCLSCFMYSIVSYYKHECEHVWECSDVFVRLRNISRSVWPVFASQIAPGG